MKKIIISLLLLAVILCGGWYFASPAYALLSMRDAIAEKDADRLNENIDFPLLRDSLKSEFKGKMEEQGLLKDRGLSGALGGVFADKLLDTMIDRILTPEGISALMERAEQNADKVKNIKTIKNEDNDDSETKGFDDYNIERVGLSQFNLTDPNNRAN